MEPPDRAVEPDGRGAVEPDGRGAVEPHDSDLRRADETAALAATAATIPVNVAAPVLSAGFRLLFGAMVATRRRQPFLRLNIRIDINL
jgi:hypothetical protein